MTSRALAGTEGTRRVFWSPDSRFLAFIAYYSHWFGTLIKGRPEVIWEDGNFILRTMRRNHISKHDVEEDLRLVVKTEELDDIRVGYVERSGDISFIKKDGR